MKIFNTIIDLQQSPRLKGEPRLVWEQGATRVSSYNALRGFGLFFIVERLRVKAPTAHRGT